MKWPWKSDNLEYRADDSFTNALITLLTARGRRATGGVTGCAGGRWRRRQGLFLGPLATAMVENHPPGPSRPH